MVYLTSLRSEWLPRLPSQRLVINTLDDIDFGGKVDFVEGGKLENPEKKPRSQIEINQSQPTYKPRIKPGLQWWDSPQRY